MDRRDNIFQKKNSYDASEDIVVFQKFTPDELKGMRLDLMIRFDFIETNLD